jgi:hypothetical protein
MEIIIFISAILLGIIISYVYFKPKLQVTTEINNEVAQENDKLEKQNNQLKIDNSVLTEKKEQLLVSIHDCNNNLSALKQQAEEAG